ncbi:MULTISPECIES: acyl-CoA carboxylase subunit epsilon [unclassified Streptomyces]|uniref:acyl-CoA carboxylase subunit epsilon n=1 Tax=unclassified Streptomyces TaxID=2593676 RepID=UPI00099D7731|nr:acyl-CoA carboxylase subunit epsilon [Streptomyces sp. NRRL WC-3618]
MSEPKLLKVVRGQPDETELAAVTAVLLAQLRARGHPAGPDPASGGSTRRRAEWGPGRLRHRSAVAWSAR